jgi:hypothetical protein
VEYTEGLIDSPTFKIQPFFWPSDAKIYNILEGNDKDFTFDFLAVMGKFELVNGLTTLRCNENALYN